MTQAQNQDFDINSLLDGTLNDLKDLPEFRPLPVGSYRAMFSIVPDAKVKHIFFAKLKVIETMELAEATETPVEAGAEAQVRYDLSNEFGQGAFKKILAALAEHFGAKNNRALLEEVRNPVEVMVVTKQNLNKKNGAVYTDIVELAVI
jgi:hypothetical protein